MVTTVSPSHAKPFDFSIKPRSAAAEAMVHNIFEEYPPQPSNADDL